MPNIHIMDERLSNKIAAGEVVERPSSVVKELVENAIDAKSTSIQVDLVEAGLMKIQVTDNGVGMDREDALLAFSRHATSKLLSEHDLFRIRSLGFRGEALASIAAVSKVFMQTSTGEEQGTIVRIEGGKLLETADGPLRKGTIFRVEQLFYNTPARLKYVKTIQTELGHSIDLMNRLALSHPDVAFTLTHNEQTLLQTTGRGNLQQVASSVYGVAAAKQMVPFHSSNEDFEVSGLTSQPTVNRASKNYISLFINGRWVRHFGIIRAIEEAYHTFLPIGRFPITLLSIKTDPILTDVNVHPSKHQVRLSKEKELELLITKTLRDIVRGEQEIPKVVIPKPKTVSSQPNFFESIPSGQQEAVHEIKESIHQDPEPINSREVSSPIIEERLSEELSAKDIVPSAPQLPYLEIVGQIHGTYIVAQAEDGFYLLDQHAAQERIKYEFYRDKVGEVNHHERQTLLLPLTFHFTLDEAVRLKANREQLEAVGVVLEEFGDASFVVREYPTWFPKNQERIVIEKMIELVLDQKQIQVAKLREEAAILMSCKLSIKANHYLTKDQMHALIEDLRTCEQPYTCPHGRPVAIHFSSYDTEKMFKRIM
ncbi:DNA mismatch repair endonuclease MutL [Chryseomicrobium palamuruense]|uniref:DNA mismatch repair protein MutL n=1 Tax=Chryseomicrobium palamuruense TaxID=682973 RepID=A0ABV8UTC2_9BACL